MANLDNSQLWADQPFALITSTGIASRTDGIRSRPAYKFAKEMSLVHNLVLRGLNASYNQCLSIQPNTSDASDFLLFNQCVYEVLHDHHRLEETSFFPQVEELSSVKGVMEANLQEHQVFHEGVEAWRLYAFETSAADYNGARMREILDGFGKAMERHLHNEIQTLLDLDGNCDERKMKAIQKEMEKKAVAGHDKYRYSSLFSLFSTAIDGVLFFWGMLEN
jgi:hypothetical protein